MAGPVAAVLCSPAAAKLPVSRVCPLPSCSSAQDWAPLPEPADQLSPGQRYSKQAATALVGVGWGFPVALGRAGLRRSAAGQGESGPAAGWPCVGRPPARTASAWRTARGAVARRETPACRGMITWDESANQETDKRSWGFVFVSTRTVRWLRN